MTGQTGQIGTNISEKLFKYAGLEIRFLLTSSDSNGTMSVFEFRRLPALKSQAHSNDGYEEMVYGLEGTLTWTVNDTDVQVGPGRRCVFRGVRPTAGQTTEACLPSNSLSSALP